MLGYWRTGGRLFLMFSCGLVCILRFTLSRLRRWRADACTACGVVRVNCSINRFRVRRCESNVGVMSGLYVGNGMLRMHASG